ncbi:MAG TPA: acylphosphatase [Longimicrobiales bacterium]|nr:acylphosphatase [Longimicrobiales bacterium]
MAEPASARRRYRIVGEVQGVGFRWWTMRQARELGLTGAVRNEPDGSVLLEVEGDAGAVALLRDRLDRGPPGALVRQVLELEPTSADLAGLFRIDH